MCRAFKVDHELALLSSCGCGICGAAAVMGVSGQLRAKTDNSVLAVAVVAILGTVFTLIEVTLQPYLGLDAYNYGVFTGGSLHEIAHAVAAGGAGGQVALDAAILTKLSRVLMLIVVAGVLIVVNKTIKNATTRVFLPSDRSLSNASLNPNKIIPSRKNLLLINGISALTRSFNPFDACNAIPITSAITKCPNNFNAGT